MTVTQCYPMSTSRALKRRTYGGVSIYDMFSKYAEAAGILYLYILIYLLRQYFLKKNLLLCYLHPNLLPWLSSVTKWFGLSLQWPQQNFHLEQLHVAYMAHSNDTDTPITSGTSWMLDSFRESGLIIHKEWPHLDTMAADLCPCLLIVKNNLDQLQHQVRVAASDTWK